MDIPDILNKEIDQDNFIWKNKHHYIRKRDRVKPAEGRGCKHYWLWSNEWYHQVKMVTKLYQERWFSVQNIQESWPIRFSSTSFPLLETHIRHDFTPHTVPIWDKRHILIKRKSFFYKEWMEKGMWSVILLSYHFLNTRCFHWETIWCVPTDGMKQSLRQSHKQWFLWQKTC